MMALTTTSKRRCKPTYFYSLVLHCTKTNHSEIKEIYFDTPPVNTLEIKEQIQKQFSISVCVQVLSFDGYTLKDDDKLSLLRIRNRDTLCVEYLAKANCSDINATVTWLKQLCSALDSNSPDYHSIIRYGIQYQIIESLDDYFISWSDSSGVSYANKLHFVYNGGFKLLMEVYAAILRKSWQEMSTNMKYVEQWIPSILWSFVETFSLRRLVFLHNGIQMCSQSLLRVKVEEGKLIEEYCLSHEQPFRIKYLLVGMIYGSAGTLCK